MSTPSFALNSWQACCSESTETIRVLTAIGVEDSMMPDVIEESFGSICIQQDVESLIVTLPELVNYQLSSDKLLCKRG